MQLRDCFLEATRNSLRAKDSSGLERITHYKRKCSLARRALTLDADHLLIAVSSVERWHDGRWLIGLRLRDEPHFGLHLPLDETDPLCLELLARAPRRSA